MSDESGKEWLNTNWPNMRACDVNWTMKRYDYPDHVCEHIKTHWVKINDENGGVYHKPVYDKECMDSSGSCISRGNPQNADTSVVQGTVMVQTDEVVNPYQPLYQLPIFANAMDEPNKKALGVMVNEGMDAAVKHMFTDQESGRQLSYAEMRSRYG